MSQILVIDDDPAIQLVLKKVLQDEDYEVAFAGDGLEGLEKAKQMNPSVIICDWMIPFLDGVEVCKRIKADPNLSTTFFILLTSRITVEDRVYGLDSGADDFLAKPFEPDELKARVRSGLRIHGITQDLQTQQRLLEAELNEAAEYVRSLLPHPLTGKIEIESRFIPSRRLGGDCFDYYWLDPDYLAIYLLDVSGHGLGAALLSISVLNMLRSQSMDGVNFYQPNLVLHALNEAFQMDNQNDKYFTIWYGVYNQVNRQLIYSSAGHPPAILLTQTSDGIQVQQLVAESMPIGMLPDTRFFNHRCSIDIPSTLYVFSDGIYEFSHPNDDAWSLDAFVELLIYRHKLIEYPGLDFILDSVRTINSKHSSIDDLSLLQITFS